jgi:hypothetical protein
MKYIAWALFNACVLASIIYMIMHDHPWWAFLFIFFFATWEKPE